MVGIYESIASHIKAFILKKRSQKYICALMYPSDKYTVMGAATEALNWCLPIAIERKWNPPTTASVVATLCFSAAAREKISIGDKERAINEIKNGPSSLTEELNWIYKIKNGYESDVAPLTFRFFWINGLLAGWLVNEKTIDIYAKSFFVTIATQSLAGVVAEEINHSLFDLAEKIGRS